MVTVGPEPIRIVEWRNYEFLKNKFQPILFQLENYFKNRTESTPVFNSTGLLCHSSGCDVSVKMIKEKRNLFKVLNFNVKMFGLKTSISKLVLGWIFVL